MAPGATPGVGAIPKMARPPLIKSDSDPAPFENRRLRQHMQLLVAQRFNSLVQVQLFIRPHPPLAGRVQICAPPGPAITQQRRNSGATAAQRHRPS